MTTERESSKGAKAICTALGFDPTNHHNALACSYCNPHNLMLMERPLSPAARPSGPDGSQGIAAEEARDDNMLWAELKVAQADNAALTSSLTALRGALTEIAATLEEIATTAPTSLAQWRVKLMAERLSTALAVSQ